MLGDNRIFLSSGSGLRGLALEIVRDGDRLLLHGARASRLLRTTGVTAA